MAYCSARCALESGHPSQDLQVLAGGFDVVGRASGHTSPWSLIPTSSDIPCDLRNSDPAFDKVACSSALRSGSPESSGDALPLEHLQVADLDLAKAFFEKHAMWSAGSEAHVSSSCIPCFFFHTKGGCKHGKSCTFCHMPHAHKANAQRNRASKAKRMHCRQILGLLADEFASTSDYKQAFPVLQIAASQSSFLQAFLRQWLTSADGDSEGASSLNVTEEELSYSKDSVVML